MTNKSILTGFSLLLTVMYVGAQNPRPYTSSFIGKMGVDTVLVETYTMVNNHLFGKALVRVPEDYIGEFSIHFYPDGSIREFNINAMHPLNSSIPFEAKSRAFEYRLNMNCQNDTCSYYNSDPNQDTEKVYKHATKTMDFVGGWVPLISLMEWQCLRLAKSKERALPLKMINHNIGVYDIGVRYLSSDMVVFGGPFLEYTKIQVGEDGRIAGIDGTGTPWNYIVTKHPPIDIDAIAKQIVRSRGIGIPSPTKEFETSIHNAKFIVNYGRPYMRGRKIFGGIVPYDSLWRTGANGTTTLTLEQDVRFGKTKVPKGTYAIFTIPKANEWILVFSKDTKSWPTDPDRTKDFVHITIPVKQQPTIVEQFTIRLQETKKGGVMQFVWDDTMAIAEFEMIK